MKPGDLVKKTKGRMKGETGIIVEIHNPTGHTVLSVLTCHGMTTWAKQFIEVINENA